MKRKQLQNKKYQLENFISSFEFLNNSLEGYMPEGTEEYFQNLKSCLNKLDEDLRKLPVGHRYSGTFYVRKPYTIPIESEKIEGSAFMREDLVTWKPEEEGKQFWELSYKKDIFRDPEMSVPIKREDGQPVFEKFNSSREERTLS